MRVRLNKKRCLESVTESTERLPASDNHVVLSPETLEHVAIGRLKTPRRVLRNHPRAQIEKLSKLIQSVGFLVPIVVDHENVIRAGIARYMAAKEIGMKTVPVIRAGNLSEAQLRSFQLADNKLQEKTRWNREGLALEIPELRDLLFNDPAELTLDDIGFQPPEVDQIILDGEAETRDPTDEIDEARLVSSQITKRGDLWLLGAHRLVCDDGRDIDVLKELMDGRLADMAMLDPPYNVRVKDVVGRGNAKHPDFAMASGEMSDGEFESFLQNSLSSAAAVSRDGAASYVFMDWRNIAPLMSVGAKVYGQTLNLAVWVKNNGGQGSMYRSQHELIGVFRVGDKAHCSPSAPLRQIEGLPEGRISGSS